MIPWCTGAAKAKVIVAGAVTEDGRQILFALPTDLTGRGGGAADGTGVAAIELDGAGGIARRSAGPAADFARSGGQGAWRANRKGFRWVRHFWHSGSAGGRWI